MSNAKARSYLFVFPSILWLSTHQEIKHSIQNIAQQKQLIVAASCITINKIIRPTDMKKKRNKEEKKIQGKPK